MADVWLNGVFLDEGAARIDPRDGGFLHAAGVFTTMRAANGRIFGLNAHLRRVRESCGAFSIPLPITDETLAGAAGELLRRNALDDARLRLTVTRGRTAVDPLHGETHRPTALLTCGPMTPYPAEFYERGMTVVLNAEHKLNPYDARAGHKTLDYLPRLTALRSAARRGAGEALWFDVHNRLQCGSVCNVFLVESGRVVTPPTNAELRDESVRRACGYGRGDVLPGVVRAWACERVPVGRAAVDVNRLLGADEVFLTNSVMGVMPVTRLERKVVGDGGPGEVTRGLMGAFAGALAGP